MIRAILVDDRRSHLNLLKNKLAKYSRDIEVIGAYTNQREAVTQIIHLAPDVLFLDIEMPGKNGFELAASVKEICSNVIYLTSYEKYGTDSYRHNALYFIAKDRIEEFLPEAVAKLKARLSIHAPAIKENRQPVSSFTGDSYYALKKITVTDSRKISITLHNTQREYHKEVILSVESYRTLSNFICYKLLETATNEPAVFFISQMREFKIFPNLSQAKSHFLKNINEQFEEDNIQLLPGIFFRNTDKGDYTFNLNSAAIGFNFNSPGLKLWADYYLKKIIEMKTLDIVYSIEGNEIRLRRK